MHANYLVTVILSYSILFPAALSLIYLSRIPGRYFPFILCIWIGTLNEVFSTTIIGLTGSNNINGNIYVLLEAILLTWQFERWGLFIRNRWMFPVLLLLLILIWTGENFYYSALSGLNSFFRMSYAMIIAILALSQINRLIMIPNMRLMKNPIFIISLTFVIYFLFKATVEAFWVFAIKLSVPFLTNVYRTLNIVNLISNLLFACSIFWMPTKHRSTKLS